MNYIVECSVDQSLKKYNRLLNSIKYLFLSSLIILNLMDSIGVKKWAQYLTGRWRILKSIKDRNIEE